MILLEASPVVSLFAFASLICGIVALLRLRELEGRLSRLEARARAENRSSRHHALDVSEPDHRYLPGLEESDEPIVADEPDCELEESEVPDLALVADSETPGTKLAHDDLVVTARPRERRQEPTADLESWVGRRFMAMAGSVILLAGMAFFLKYAYDCGWIGPSGRLMIGALAGAACLVVASMEAGRKLGDWADVVSGLGFSIWYVCIYFAFAIYELWGAPLAFSVAAVVTLAAMGLAWRRNSLVLMLLALVGGHLSPVLLSHETGEPLVLFGWIAMLSIAGLTSAARRGWNLISVLTLVGGGLLYLSWSTSPPAGENETKALAFLLVWFVIHALVPYLSAFLRRGMPRQALQLVSFVGVTMALLGLNSLYVESPLMMASIITIASAVHLVVLLVKREATEFEADLRCAIGTQGAVVLVTGLGALAGLPFVPTLAAALAAGLARRSRSMSAGTAANIASVGAALIALSAMLLCLPGSSSIMTPFLNRPFVGGMLVSFLLALGAIEAQRRRADATKPDIGSAALLAVAALASVGLAWQFEVARWWAQSQGQGSMLISHYESLCLELMVWSILSIGVAAIGLRTRNQGLKIIAVLPLGMVIALAFSRMNEILADPSAPTLFLLNMRTMSALVFATALAINGWSLQREIKLSQDPRGGPILMSLALIVTTLTLHLDVLVFWDSRGAHDLERMRSWLVLWTLMLFVWSVFCRLRPRLVAEAPVRVVQLMSILLLMVAIERPFAAGTLPILNFDLVLRAVLGAAVAGSGRVFGSRGTTQAQSVSELVPHVALAGAMAANLWNWSAGSSAVLPFLGPVDQQLGLGLISAIWSLHALSLTAAGFVFRRKDLRVMGLAFFGVVLMKVMLIDTGSLPRVHRIISFIASGLLMLLGSYVYQRVARNAAATDATAAVDV